jgi:hypothetical protein
MNSYKVMSNMRRLVLFPRPFAVMARAARKSLAWAALPACIAFQLAALNVHAFAQATVGLVGGITRDSASGKPVGGSQITAHNLDKGTDHTTVADASGIFTFTNLEPGQYEFAATKSGFQKSSARSQVIAGRTARVDLTLQAASAQTADASSSLAKELEAMKARIEQLEAELKSKQTPAQSADVPDNAEIAENGRTILRPNAQASAPIAGPAASAVASLPDPKASQPFDMARATAPGPLPAQVPAPASPQEPASPAPPDKFTPFADYDWTWLNGNSRQHDTPLDTKYFSGEFRADTFYGEDFNQPIDHSMGGSSEVFRNNEVQLEDLSIGGDLHDGNMRGRVLLLYGMFSSTTVRNDASPAVGQWDVRSAYKYVSEAYGGYHWNVNHGLNVDAGIFVSYVGLFSYYNYDNWAYQPSYVSSNTPWFFNGVRIQWFPTNHLKIEPWFINGWQSYNRFNGHPGLGGQIKWTPKPWMNIIGNQYGVGNDNVGLPNRGRYHTDNSIEIKYFDRPQTGNGLDKMAFTFTGDAGCETGDGVTCHGGKGPYNPATGAGGPKQSFLGYMAYNRWWWHKDIWAFTLGGGQINNPGRYLTLVLPVNGADAISGTPYFPSYPGAPFKAYDGTATLDYMPTQFVTFRMEFGYRHANVPYWTGRHGITPPGGNNGSPADFVCASGASSGFTDLPDAEVACGGGKSSVWFPDLRQGQALLNFAILVKL